jgi:hypothetical protein
MSSTSHYEVYYGPIFGANKLKEKKYKSCDIIKCGLLLIDYNDILKVDYIDVAQCRLRILTNNIENTNMIKVSLSINNKNYDTFCEIPLEELKHKNIVDFKPNNLVTLNLGLNEIVLNNKKEKKYITLDVELYDKSLKKLQNQLSD